MCVPPTPQLDWQRSSRRQQTERSPHDWRLRLGSLLRSTVTWRLVVFGTMTLAGLVAVAGGMWLISQQTHSVQLTDFDIKEGNDPDETYSHASKSAAIELPSREIYVDISGAVAQPGLYQLPPGSRLAAVIEKAGGFSEQADELYVSQELNLARELTDGEKVYIQTTADRAYQKSYLTNAAAEVVNATNSHPDSKNSSSGTSLISINSASASELQSLSGIGEKRSADIIADRPYKSLSELVEQGIITQRIYDEIEPQLSL